MFLAIIFFITNSIIIGCIALVYGKKEQYNQGMLFGVHIPEEQRENSQVVKITENYQKSFRYFNWGNILLSLVTCGLCFINSSIAMVLWLVWMVFYIAVAMVMIYSAHRKMYQVKFQNQWIMKETAREIIIDGKTWLIDDDEYWKKGWYDNPKDPHILVPDRLNSTNYSFNMGRTGSKITLAVIGFITIASIFAVYFFIIWMDTTEITMSVTDTQITIDAAMYDLDFSKSDIKSVEIIKELPKDDFTRTNGGATDHYLVGHFKGEETGKCMLYIYREASPILKIVLEDKLIFINSKQSGQVEEWYKSLTE